MASTKVVKANGATASPLENMVGKALTEINVPEIASEIAALHILAVKEVEVSSTKKALVVFVPYRQHKKYQKVQARLVVELEKKFPGCHFVFIAQRNVISPEIARFTGQARPRSRTLTTVQNAILDDLVFPATIVGKRIRVRQDQTQLLKVFLDPKCAKEAEDKLKTFAAVYSKLTRKAVEFHL
jgi:small subunit ribosomal protein S7e|eukprot:TRINITY_DN109850_c0_g1_i1.p2 TRINITY_DN109850_c0_g1~~TRINITY_DN109850_c0_g1_i1.p2  ORF type:complete len:184 (-),score=27.32 TRINITY_DN109850_c0_g1_i1:84-635(-)